MIKHRLNGPRDRCSYYDDTFSDSVVANAKKQLNGMFYSQYVNTIVSLVIVVFTTGITVQEVMVSNYFPIDIVIKIPGNVSTIWNRNCRYLPQANTIILWDSNKNCLE